MDDRPSYYEFFAGGGMARAGLGEGWRCLFANDFDAKKAQSYRVNWGGEHLHVGDVGKVETSQLPETADLAWASFPCQDLSLAGGGAGLKGERSGTFWPFWELMKKLGAEQRAPKLIVLENVCGALTSHGGEDFTELCKALAEQGYRFGAVVIDAALFVPQSRPRLFIVAVHEDVAIPASLAAPARPCERSEAIQSGKAAASGSPRRFIPHSDGEREALLFFTRALLAAQEQLPATLREKWLWWRLPAPPLRNTTLTELTEDAPQDVAWRSRAETQALLALMSDVNLEKLEAAKRAGRRMVGTLYRRTRCEDGRRTQRAEVRFDDVAGCLRTPAGGSSRQYVLEIEQGEARSRLMSARETARLMGLPDTYALPARYNDAYHLMGDGVVAPVVRHIAAHLLEPLLVAQRLCVAA